MWRQFRYEVAVMYCTASGDSLGSSTAFVPFFNNDSINDGEKSVAHNSPLWWLWWNHWGKHVLVVVVIAVQIQILTAAWQWYRCRWIVVTGIVCRCQWSQYLSYTKGLLAMLEHLVNVMVQQLAALTTIAWLASQVVLTVERFLGAHAKF